MMNVLKSGKLAASVSILAVAGIFFSAPAYASECPAEYAGDDVRTSGASEAAGVTDEELSAIDLGEEIGLEDRRLRFRRLEVEPGGVVPWHDHTGRPALIYTAEGEITEFRSDCAVGITHEAGDISTETAGLKHWWKNEGDDTAVLYAADVKNDKQ